MVQGITRLIVSSGVAVLLGGRSVRVAFRRTPGRFQIGAWSLDLTLSSQSATMYQRARDARFAPYALPAPEAIYYTAFTDSDGQVLRRGCTYRIEGTDPDTRWWSLSAYSSNRLIPNLRNRYSFTKTMVNRLSDGNWSIIFSPREHAGNWLPGATESGPLKLVLRCYGPGPELLANPTAVPLPRIRKGAVR